MMLTPGTGRIWTSPSSFFSTAFSVFFVFLSDFDFFWNLDLRSAKKGMLWLSGKVPDERVGNTCFIGLDYGMQCRSRHSLSLNCEIIRIRPGPSEALSHREARRLSMGTYGHSYQTNNPYLSAVQYCMHQTMIRAFLARIPSVFVIFRTFLHHSPPFIFCALRGVR